jgi:hypothetical protein
MDIYCFHIQYYKIVDDKIRYIINTMKGLNYNRYVLRNPDLDCAKFRAIYIAPIPDNS